MSLGSERQRKIIHVDMDAFYASVEQRDQPKLRGKPVVVGGPPQSRSVVASASYEARAYGIRSAMPCAHAAQLCPSAIFVSPRFDAYKQASKEIMQIFSDYTELIEPLSLDEAFLDVTENKPNIASATWIAQEIQRRILEQTGLTASAGVAPNKFLAKIASDMNKPHGITIIPPANVTAVLETLPVKLIPGVGKVTAEKMAQHGIFTTKDIQSFPQEQLIAIFGKAGAHYSQIARGLDDRPVRPERARKSVGIEYTFPKDIIDIEDIHRELSHLAEKLWKRKREISARGLTLKITFADFEKITRSRTLPDFFYSAEEILEIALDLLGNTEAGKRPLRLLGLSLSHFELPVQSTAGAVQLKLAFPPLKISTASFIEY